MYILYMYNVSYMDCLDIVAAISVPGKGIGHLLPGARCTARGRRPEVLLELKLSLSPHWGGCPEIRVSQNGGLSLWLKLEGKCVVIVFFFFWGGGGQ